MKGNVAGAAAACAAAIAFAVLSPVAAETADASSSAGLTHRWSFNGDLVDSVGGAVAAKIGDKVTVGAKCVSFRGNGHGAGSLVLGTNILDTAGATIEIWAAQNACRAYARVFDYGSDDGNYVQCAWAHQNNARWRENAAAVSFRRNNESAGATGEANELSPFEFNVEYYIAFAFVRQDDGTTLVRFQRRNAKTGAIQKEGAYAMTCGLDAFADPVLYIGHSQFSSDPDAYASYNEVRVWNRALTDAQMAASAAAGPDAMIDGTEFVPPEGAESPLPSAPVKMLGEGAATQWGRIAYGADRPGMEGVAWRDLAPSVYTARGVAEAYDVIAAKTELEKSQLRFDGWFKVSADEAGRWRFHENCDDCFAFAIDGEWYIHNNTYGYDKYAAADLAEGWHRYTIVCGDTYGGWGPALDGGTCALMVEKPGGSGEVPFSAANVMFGSGSPKVVLDKDEDWRGEGEVVVAAGATLDLNGHMLIGDSISVDAFAAGISNSAASASAILVVAGGAQSIAADIPETVTVSKAPFPGGFVEDGKPVRFMTYNIAYCRTGKGEIIDPASVASVVNAEAPDFCALNETSVGRHDYVDAPGELASLTGMHATFGNAQNNLGVTLLSKQKPLAVFTHLLPVTHPETGERLAQYEGRILLVCEFPDFYVATSHLDTESAWRDAYIPIVRRHLASYGDKPVFFMGDWNARPSSAHIASIKEDFAILTPTAGVRTYTARNATGGYVIDYIAVDKAHAGGFYTAGTHVTEAWEVSDHNPVVVDVIPLPETSALGWIHETALTTGATGSWSDGAAPKEMDWDPATRRAALSGRCEFKPDETGALAAATVDVVAVFDPMSAEVTAPDGNAKCAVTIGPEGSFLVWTSGDVPAWLEVSADGVAPEPGTEYAMRFAIDYAAQTFAVSVNDGGEYKALASADGATSFKFATAGRSLAKVVFQGSGEIAAIFGSRVAVEGFSEDDEVLLKDNASVFLTAAQAAWLNGLGDRAAVGGRIAAVSADDFNNAFLLNLDITKDGLGYRFGITDIEVDREENKVVVGVSLVREEDGAPLTRPINGRLVFYGAETLEAFKDSSLQPLGGAGLSNADFSAGDSATAEIPLEGDASSNFYKAAIE